MVLRGGVLCLALAVALCVGAAEAGGRPSQAVPRDAIAVVDGEPVSRRSYEDELQRIRRGYELRKRAFPARGTRAHERIKDRVVASLVRRVEVRQKAKRDFGIEISAAEVNRNVDQLRQQWGADERRFRRMLEHLGLTVALLREDIRARLTYRAVVERIRSLCRVSDDEIAAYYDARRAEYTAPASRDVRHILVRTRAAAARLRAQALAGASFARLAARHSLDRRSRAKGGLVTVFLGAGQPRFEQAAFTLRRGSVSRPVRTRAGWHLIKAVSSVRPPQTAALTEVYSAIQELLLRREAEHRTWVWWQELPAEFAGKVVYREGFEPRR